MTARLQDPPLTRSPLDGGDSLPSGGRFNTGWFGWFTNLVRAVQDWQDSRPINLQDSRTFVGPGPVTNILLVNTTRPCTLHIVASILQSFVTSAPSWALHIFVDGIDHNTGTIATWQGLATFAIDVAVAKGSHNITFQWVSSTANGSVSSQSYIVTPIYN